MKATPPRPSHSPEDDDLLRGWYRPLFPSELNDRRLSGVSIEAELLYHKIKPLADDYGVTLADPGWIRANVFRRRSGVRDADVKRWLGELMKAGLVASYSSADDDYLVLSGADAWPAGRNGKRRRKYPRPSEEDRNRLESLGFAWILQEPPKTKAPTTNQEAPTTNHEPESLSPNHQHHAEPTTAEPSEPATAEAGAAAGAGVDEKVRQQKRALLLANFGVTGAKAAELIARADIDPASLEEIIADIQSDPTVERPAAVLVTRLKDKNPKPTPKHRRQTADDIRAMLRDLRAKQGDPSVKQPA